MTAKSNRCPECNWRFPIARISAPVKRREGIEFDCPDCLTKLRYSSGGLGIVYNLFNVIALPVIVVVVLLKPQQSVVGQIALAVAIVIALIAAYFVHTREYVERVEALSPSDLPPKPGASQAS